MFAKYREIKHRNWYVAVYERFFFFFFFLFDDYRTTPNTATYDIESIGNERLTIFYKIAMVPLFLVSTCTSNDLEFVVLRCIDTTIYVHVYIYICLCVLYRWETILVREIVRHANRYPNNIMYIMYILYIYIHMYYRCPNDMHTLEVEFNLNQKVFLTCMSSIRCP